ncbi:MAG: adenosylcobinamide-phosphate synthase CbiB [Desulfobacterales bacterium]|nr:adenosylcobinamide-phosphate synthase CbiB [Desulfobacterales bacterium]MDD4070833.1 adenosylcobinamide-phosphate synthase CbiB [Desulfobacterales bacterium]MDD4391235.1 adenosylcobinamide-phosphate synthase CbiB [Desulfobacterales bacterium]
MDYYHFLYVLPAVFVLDLLLGDPPEWPHPVRWMGRAISAVEPDFRGIPIKPTISGGLFALFLILCTWVATYLILKVAYLIHPVLKIMIEMVLIYFCISIRSLEKAAMVVSAALSQNKLDDARQKVSLIVGRDVKSLDENGVARASVETVAENLVDGIISPLFFAAIGGAPLAMAYKMVNTLDSMVGYKNETYREFGTVSARIDDILNYLPARLSVPLIALAAQLINRKGAVSFKTAWKEGANHSSPNSGYSEAAFAGALGVKLGGPNFYHGILVTKPFIGEDFGETGTAHIKRACDLMLLSSIFWGAALWLIIAGVIYFA